MQEGSDMAEGGGRASLYNSDGGGRGAEWEVAERPTSFDLQLAHDDSGEPEAAAVSCHTCHMQSYNTTLCKKKCWCRKICGDVSFEA